MSTRNPHRLVLIFSEFGGVSQMGDLIVQRPHIGIVAGTAEGAALCYRTLCLEAEQVLGRGYGYPEITLHSVPLHRYLDAIDWNDWGTVAALMSRSAATLVRAGADLVICPNNTLHRAWDSLDASVPWLHIADPVVKEISRCGWRRVGVLGTRIVMEGDIYSSRLERQGVTLVLPKQDDRVRLQDVIRTELLAGLFASDARVFVQRVIAGMAAEGAEAVILGCTELPILISGNQSALPLLDSTRLLAHAALRYRIGQVNRSRENTRLFVGSG
jgi:aspartate racemase